MMNHTTDAASVLPFRIGSRRELREAVQQLSSAAGVIIAVDRRLVREIAGADAVIAHVARELSGFVEEGSMGRAPVAAFPRTPDADGAATAAYRKASKADATLRAYRADWRDFASYCAGRRLAALPAEPETIAAYLCARANAGRKVSTIERKLSAIKLAHSVFEPGNPVLAPLVKETLSGIRRKIGTAQRRKAAITIDRLRAMLGQVPDTLRGKRDRALLVTGFAGALRRSELVGLDAADLDFESRGVRITVRRSKTDQEGNGQVVPILNGPVLRAAETLRAWLRAARIESGPVFRRVHKGDGVMDATLSAGAVSLIVKHYAEAAGLDAERFSGHSLRAGFLTTAAQYGAPIYKMAEVSRHKSLSVLQGYIRQVDVFTNHAGAEFL